MWDLAEGLPTIVEDGSTKYITGPGGLPIEQVAGDGSVLYYLQDQLGSTRGLTDSSGSVISTYSYDAYGTLTGSTGTATTPFGYAGQYTDSESGLQYLRARYYEPQTCQFLTVDPLVGLTQSPYSYTPGDPVNFDDPMGLWGIGDAGNFIHQNAQTIALVGYGAAAGAVLACGVFSLGVCWVGAGVVVGADLATGGLLIGGTTLAATALLPPGEGAVPPERLGDLCSGEVEQIQSVVDNAGRPLTVVGSAAKGTRKPGSDIDYIAPPGSQPYLKPLAGRLPGLDPNHGILVGGHNPVVGPGIRFEPGVPPRFIPEIP